MTNHAANPVRSDRPGFGELKPFNPLKVIVFDCDGVLFDSKEANIRFYTHVMERVTGPPVRPEHYEFIHMHPVSESLRYLLDDDERLRAAVSYCQGIDFREFHAYLRCEPGLLELLELAKSSFNTAVATNRTISARDVLVYFDIDKYFDLVVSASDVEHPKPHPAAMHKIQDAFGARAEEILFVGDSSVDEALAMATGVYFAAYKNTGLRAHIHVSHFNELHPVLNGNPYAILRAEAALPS